MLKTFPHFDPAWAAQLAEFCADSYAEQIAYVNKAPESATQIDYVLAANYAIDCACVTYALGAAHNDVHVWLARATNALAQVFRLRGTTLPITVLEDEVSPANGAGPDFSLTNSRRGLLAMYTALVVGDRELAEEIAGLVGDPKDASYIGPDSEVCTPEEQQLAYAVKSHLLGRDAVATFYATGFDTAPLLIRHQANAVNAIIGRDKNVFLDALRDLIEAHTKWASDERNAREPRRLMCLPALGLATLALGLGMVTYGQLLIDSIYFPLRILEDDSSAS